MSTRAAKKLKVESLPQCPYGIVVELSWAECLFHRDLSLGSKCYRKNPAHFQEYLHSDVASTAAVTTATATTTASTTTTDAGRYLGCVHFYEELFSSLS